MKRLLVLLFICFGINAFSQTVTIYVKSGSIPMVGVTVDYTCDWAASLGGWQSWNSGLTDANGKLVTPNGANLNNVTIKVSNIPWAVQQLYGNVVYPASYTYSNLSSSPTIEFNTQQIVPVITINKPNNANMSIAYGGVCDLAADVTISGDVISTVLFEVAGKSFNGVISSGSVYVPQSAWTPGAADFYKTQTLKVTATSSKGTITTKSFDFYLGCASNCPNMLPVVSLTAPSNLAVNQVSGFAPITIKASITDGDGSITAANITINGGSHAMTSLGGNSYSYTFTPSAYTTYSFTISGTDNSGGITTLNNALVITNSNFTPLPKHVVVGYWHSWDNASAPFMYLKDLIGTKYNVVNYSFIETVNSDGFTPNLTTFDSKYLTGGVFDPKLLKADIKALKDAGVVVMASIGGQNGHVLLTSVAQKNTFVQGIYNIIDTYGFDGLDLDFEGGSMAFGAGAIPNFSYATASNGSFPKLQNMIDAIKEIKGHYGTGFHITCAPEVFYVQVGYSAYSDVAGAFLPFLDNIRNELDFIHVQLYNTGSVSALDGKAYSQATPDFIVSMCDMLLKGFNVATTGIHFNALAQEQVVVGIPACAGAAPSGGYIVPSEAIKAFDYLTKGISFGGTYNLGGAVYPNLRGAMTWSVNWDKACTNYGWANAMSTYFKATIATETPSVVPTNEIKVYPTINNGIIHIDGISEKVIISIYNNNGELVRTADSNAENTIIDISDKASGMYYVTVYSSNNKTTAKVILIKDL